MNLETLLHSTFGFPAFRANQEAVCRAATEGRDVLLVMPTGAGKSLCYQLPAIARGGTALVISPLIALMDDQANKLTAAGLRVARIHSGLSRDEARQACRDYLDGTLQFLFIAPERMRVPGFPEMLAKKKPALIAIDEAHCISAWGHDFRPDYRTLGDHLPALRPAPIIALTATATPTVQKDIVNQLNLQSPALFIHGFRRDNLAIEVVEMSKPRRTEFAVKLLKNKQNLPAIVYAPSRKAAEELASQLGSKASAYHAGLDPATRERVQRHFLAGSLDIVVATIAFGMGIDKADVRTVLHIALPGSVEAYYQEIGRAGRDGLPSRTILLHSFVDRKIHETFLERDYPPATELDRVARALKPEFLMPEPLWRQLRMSPDIFGKAVEKLASQGAAQIDMAGNVRSTGLTTWRTGYETQVAFRKSQIERMATFADTHQCRMTALIRHFGDTADGTRPCGHCDACDPASATSQSSLQPPDSEELRQLSAILRALDGQSRSTGKLHTELAAGALRGTPAEKDRRTFEALLDCLSRAALISITPEQWTNPAGELISFKKAALTYEGREAAEQGLTLTPDLLLRETDAPAGKKGKASSPKATRRAVREDASAAFTPAQRALETSLREWRKVEAAKTGKPAFIIFGDAVLTAIVEAQPTTISALLNVSGIGPEKADRYGAAICALCRNEQVETAEYGTPTTPAKKTRPASQSKLTLSQDSPDRGSHPSSTTSTKGGVKTSTAAKPATVPVRPSFTPRPAATNPQPEVELTPDQQAVDTRLRDWRKTESERLGLPQFFVLGSSTLRSLVLQQPKTIAQLQSISGIGPEKAAKFGPQILQVLNQ
ncbi:ATP-dependent DNA helicase RecQ [Granulicella pectinivorans]|uniref:ATP-dependent DNA helicase RecQ n=1 Tax=Granulicella pectinivorans TaxID=474950 RepID=A0A1I6MMX8_9BACT|nr:RecQ family ATP-dependent DNA helicase [Granulicella pectinivorans]SFS17039.1 ATP-dependent DNA helicase RecQ [Granulicella pectinivorans]